MRGFLLLIFSLGLVIEMASQTAAESIRTKLQSATDDSLRIVLLLELGNSYQLILPDSAMAAYDSAYRLYARQHNSAGKAKARQLRGKVLATSGRNTEALFAFEEAIRLFKKEKNIREEANAWNDLGTIYLNLGMYRDAVQAYSRAIPALEKNNESAALTAIYTNLGECYRELGEYAAMLDQHLKLYELALPMGRPIESGKAALRMGEALSLNGQPDSAKYYVQEAYRTGLNQRDTTLILSALHDLCELDLKLGLTKEVLIKSDSLLLIARQFGRADGILQALMLQGKGLEASKKYKASLDAYEEALNLAKANGSHEQQASVLQRLIELNGFLGKFEDAFSCQRQWKDLNDSLHIAEKSSFISAMRNVYELVEKDKRALDAKKIRGEKKWVIEQRWGYLITGSILLIVLALITFTVIRSIRQRKKLANQEAEVKRVQAMAVEKEQEALRYKSESQRKDQEVKNLRAILRVQEDEQRKVASALNAGLGEGLTAARSGLDEIGREAGNSIPVDLFLQVRNLLTRSSQDLLEISQNLEAEGLEANGIVASLQSLCRKLSTSQIQIEWELNGTERAFGKMEQLHILRIAQELLHNSVKHSRASRVLVSLTFTPKELTLLVEDNGIGLSKEQAGQGNGLRSIQARSAYLNATIDILSGPSKGTSFTILIPIAKSSG